MEIIKSFEHAIGRYVVVTVGEDTTAPTPCQIITIQGDSYTELMGANPTWSPNKPANTFRQDDLWEFVTRFRNGTLITSTTVTEPTPNEQTPSP